MNDIAASTDGLGQPIPSHIETFLQALFSRSVLSSPEQKAILLLSGHLEQLKAGREFVRLGDDATSSCLVLDGFCARVNLPTDERRVITAIYVPGNMPDLYSVFVPEAAAPLEALTPATILRIPHAQIRELMHEYPAITEAFTRYLAADATITAQCLKNVAGRRASHRVAHLFCEMAVRLNSATNNAFAFGFSLSQDHLAQACGMSSVHMNRSLGELREAHLVIHKHGTVHILDWERLKALAHFNDRYLVAKGERQLFH